MWSEAAIGRGRIFTRLRAGFCFFAAENEGVNKRLPLRRLTVR